MTSTQPASPFFLDPRALQSEVDSTTWQRAQPLWLQNRVVEVNVDWAMGGWQVYGSVQGSQRWPYEVSIDLTFDARGRLLEWEPDCSCPVGYKCKHAVALLLKAASLSGPQAIVAAPPILSPEEQVRIAQAAEATRRAQAEQQAEAELQRWLQTLALPAPTHAGPAALSIRPEFLFYLLSLQPAGDQGWKLQFEVKSSFRKLNGDWSKPKALNSHFSVTQPQFRDQLEPADHDVIQLLPALRSESQRYQYGMVSRVEPMGGIGALLLQRAASTGRLHGCILAGERLTGLRWGDPQALEWRWQEVAPGGADQKVWTLSPYLRSDSAHLCADQLLYLDLEHGCCGQVDCSPLTPQQALQRMRAPKVPTSVLRKHQIALLEYLPSVAPPPVLAEVRILRAAPTWHLHLSLVPPERRAVHGLLQGRLDFDYGGHRGSWPTPSATVLLSDAQGQLVLQRDLASEQAALACLQRLGLLHGPEGQCCIPADRSQEAWLEWADQDFEPLRVAGFVVETDAGLQGWIRRADSLSVECSHAGESEASSPWFDLSLGIEIEGRRYNVLPLLPLLPLLPELLARLAESPLDEQTGQPRLPEHVYLPDQATGGFLRLPTEALRPWLAALLELFDERDFSGGQLRLSRLEAMRALAAMGQGVAWEGAGQLRALVDSLRGQQSLPTVPLPAGLQAELRPYQIGRAHV